MPRLAWNRAATAAFVLALLWPLVTLDSAAALATPRSSQSPRRDTPPGPARGPDFEASGIQARTWVELARRPLCFRGGASGATGAGRAERAWNR